MIIEKQIMLDLLNEFYPEATPLTGYKRLEDCFQLLETNEARALLGRKDWLLHWNDLNGSSKTLSEGKLKKHGGRVIIRWLQMKYRKDYLSRMTGLAVGSY